MKWGMGIGELGGLQYHCSPCFRVNPGDIVTVGQCRPLSKTVRFNILRIEPQKVVGNLKRKCIMSYLYFS